MYACTSCLSAGPWARMSSYRKSNVVEAGSGQSAWWTICLVEEWFGFESLPVCVHTLCIDGTMWILNTAVLWTPPESLSGHPRKAFPESLSAMPRKPTPELRNAQPLRHPDGLFTQYDTRSPLSLIWCFFCFPRVYNPIGITWGPQFRPLVSSLTVEPCSAIAAQEPVVALTPSLARKSPSDLTRPSVMTHSSFCHLLVPHTANPRNCLEDSFRLFIGWAICPVMFINCP